MNDYDELKKELHRLNRAISTKHHEIQKINDDLKTIEQEKEAAKNNSESTLQSDYQSKYKQHLDSLIGPIDREITAVRKELEDEETDFQTDFNSLTEEKFYAQCTDTQELLNQLQEMSSELRTRLQDLVGTRLYTNVSRNLKENEMHLDVEDLDRAIAYFNECEDKTNEMLARPDYIGDFIKKSEDKLHAFELGTTDSKGAMILLAIAIIILFMLLYKFVFPFYIIFVCVVGLFHVFRTYNVYEVLLVQKAITDNIDSIEQKLHDDASYAAEQARATLQQEHQEKVTMLKQKLDDLTDKQTNATNASKSSFFYDGSAIKGALDSKLINLEKREADNVTNKLVLQKELNELTTNLNELKQKMQSVFSAKQNEYLNYEGAGTDFVFDSQFLLDIDDVTKKLVFFDYPENSALFLYKDKEDAVDFIKLINVQIRSKLDPAAYEVVYFDPIHVGQDCLFFVPEVKKKGDTAERLFRIVSDPGKFTEVIENYRNEMIQRQKSFRQDGDIASYNKHMLQIESLPIPYYFAFLLDPDDASLTKIGAITRAAGMYGIYICTFINEADFKELGRRGKDVVESYSSFYVIQNGKVNSRAKDFVLDTYCSDK